MPRPRNVIPSVRRYVSLPEDLATRVDLLLFDETEGRIPYSAYADFVARLLREFLESEVVDLSPWGISGHVRGAPSVIAALKRGLTS